MHSLGATFAAVGCSAAFHAALLLTSSGHAATSAPGQDVLTIELVPESTPVPDAPLPEPSDDHHEVAHWHSHTHPYPVPADHDLVPHDPNLVHTMAPAAAAPNAPLAAAAPADTSFDATIPRFNLGATAGGTTGGDSQATSPGAAGSKGNDTPGPALSEQTVDTKAHLVHGHPPAYPEAAREAGLEGDVMLEIVVGVSGAVETARVVHGMGHDLDEAAVRAVKQYSFAPASKAGKPARVRMYWPVQFRLN